MSPRDRQMVSATEMAAIILALAAWSGPGWWTVGALMGVFGYVTIATLMEN